jgi:surfeit locus 1 family protein
MLAGYSFRPRGWALAAAALACAAGIALGNWQARRAEEKRVVRERLEAALKSPPIEIGSAAIEAKPHVLKRVAVRGRFVAEHTVYLQNRIRRGRVGYEVLTPLRISNSEIHILINRGWSEEPRSPTLAGELRLEGIALERLPRMLQLKEEPKSRVRQNLDLAAYGAETGLRLQPLIVEQHSDTGDGLARDWPRPDAGIEKHQGYALQWYSLAALAVALALGFSFRRIEASSK